MRLPRQTPRFACNAQLAVILLIFVAPMASASPLDAGYFLDLLSDPEALARVDYVETRMRSTWDRSGANDDGFRPEWVKDGVYTIAELQGPGVVTRLWTARPAGTCRFFLDGASKPLIDMPCEQFFAGATEPFVRPLAGPMGGGNYSFFPIPYARSLRFEIAADRSGGAENYGGYHHVNYKSFPAATPIESLTLPLSAATRQKWEATLSHWREPTAPRAKGGPQQSQHAAATIKAGQSLALADIAGAGIIDEFHLELGGDVATLRDVLLRATWDDQERPSIDTPVGDFFGNGYDRVPFQSLLIGLTGQGYYSYFSMPFSRRARIELINESANRPVTVRARLVYRQLDSLPDGYGRFHAKWRRQEMSAVDLHGANLSARHNYPILEAHGSGRYIGATFNVWNRQMLWWGEGDPMIFVDGEDWPPSHHGTGTEEYFNDAWGFHEFIESVGADPGKKEQNVVPVSGVLLAGLSSPGRLFGPNAEFSFHVGDSIPFEKSINVSIEHGPENDLTNDYSSVAYWYAMPGGNDFFQMRPVHERRVPSPDSWERLRQQRLREFAPELKRQVIETAGLLDRYPTDERCHPPRIRVLRLVFQLAEHLNLPQEESRRLDQRLQQARKLPQPERWPIMDEIFGELATLFESQ